MSSYDEGPNDDADKIAGLVIFVVLLVVVPFALYEIFLHLNW